MKRILVPCDFSEQSVNALKFAVQLETTSRAEIDLLHVVEVPPLHDSLLMPTLYFEELKFQDIRKNAESKLDQIVKKYSAPDLKLKRTVDFGVPSKKILEYIGSHSVDLVVMGTKGATGMREVFLGSNAEKIVRASGVPVIAIKDEVRPRKIKNIVFPNTIDSDSHEDLVMKVKDLQHALNAHLHIVYINTPLNFKQDIVTRQNLAHFTKRYLLKDCTTSIFNDMVEESGIINFTKMIDADMIAVGTHGRKGLAHLLSGSLAEDLVNHAKLPIWTYTIKKER
jgi:nucleotide-binding universal stress UspA family protein